MNRPDPKYYYKNGFYELRDYVKVCNEYTNNLKWKLNNIVPYLSNHALPLPDVKNYIGGDGFVKQQNFVNDMGRYFDELEKIIETFRGVEDYARDF